MKTAVDTIFVGKNRAYNRRFQQMCGHYLVDPVACTPASGWEKWEWSGREPGGRAPAAVLRAAAEVQILCRTECLARGPNAAFAYAKANRHPDIPDKTIWEVFEEERSSLVPYVGPFDGFHAVPASVSKTCLVRFDKNRYSVDARAVGRPVEIRAYADRLECWQDGRHAGRRGRHERAFGRGKTIYDPLHYIPVLARKPGALRNGAPFKDWDLPPALRRVQRKLERQPGGDRQVVEILGAVLTDGLEAVEAACSEALAHNVHSAGVVLNILARRPRTAAAPDNHDAGCVAPEAEAGPRARGQLRSLRQPEENREWNDHRCWTRHGIGAPQLKLYGMRTAYDEIIATRFQR
jgi:hypothetical protein